jgi:predicted transcriptional regulator
MVNHRLRSMQVLERDQRLAGIISRKDVMRALQGSAAAEAAQS